MMMNWTEDEVSLLLTLNKDGLSATEMSAVIETKSRNAIIGKLHRMHVPMTNSSGGRRVAHLNDERKERPKKQLMLNRKIKIQSVNYKQLPLENIDVSRNDGKTLVELEHNHCRWPFGETDIYFCGRQILEGTPYCYTHYDVSRRKPDQWQ